MLANVIQMEALALSTAAKHKGGAAILIDVFGHPEAVARRMRELAPGRAVIDVGGAALAALSETIAEASKGSGPRMGRAAFGGAPLAAGGGPV